MHRIFHLWHLFPDPDVLLEQPRMHLILAAWLPILYAGILSNGVAYTLQFLHSGDFLPLQPLC